MQIRRLTIALIYLVLACVCTPAQSQQPKSEQSKSEQSKSPSPTNATSTERLAKVRQIEALLDKGQNNSALALARDGSYKADATFLLLQSRALEAMQKHKEALFSIDKALLLESQSPDCWAQKVKVLSELDDDAALRKAVNTAIKLNSKDAQVWGNKALLETKEGKWEAAIASANAAIRLDPKLSGAYTSRGLAYLTLNKYELALADANRYIALEPRRATGYNNRGLLNTRLHRFGSALRDLDMAIKLEPTMAEAYNNRSIAHMNLGNQKQALADADSAIKKGLKSPYPYSNKGVAYLNMGQLERAKVELNRAITIDPSCDCAYVALAEVALQQKEFDKALAYVNKAIKANPHNGDALHTRSKIFIATNKTDKGASDLERAMAMSKNPQIFRRHAQLSAQSGYYEQALDDLAHVQPQNGNGAAINLKSYDRVIALYDKMIAQSPSNFELLYDRGLVCLVVGNFERASKDLGQYLVSTKYRSSQSGEAASLLFVALERLKKNEQAAASFASYMANRQSKTSDLVTDLLAGRVKFEEARSIWQREADRAKRTRMGTIIAMHLINRGQTAMARQILQDVVSVGDRQLDEYVLAAAELRRIK